MQLPGSELTIHRRFVKIIGLLSLFAGCWVSNAAAQLDTLRIATYNLLFFPSAIGNQRVDDFRKIIRFMDPDILVVEELETQAGLITFLNDVMNADGTKYQAAPFSTTPDLLNNGLFYKQDKVQLLGMSEIEGTPRDVTEYILLAFQREFSIYALHLKAGSNTSDQNQRLNQTSILRNFLNDLPAGSDFLVCGDFNVQSSSEAAFQKLIESQADNDGRLFDPINQLGTWHNNAFFSTIHTQSTRGLNDNPGDDGSTGGLDDRFDFILVSNSLLSGGGIDVVPSTYKALGNDGNRCCNTAVNAGNNLAVPDSIADALHDASDHLPVVADFVFGFPTAVQERAVTPEAFSLAQNYPNPFNPTTKIKYSLKQSGHVSIRIYNLRGEELAVLFDGLQAPGEHEVEFDARNLPSGLYIYRVTFGDRHLQKKMLLLR